MKRFPICPPPPAYRWDIPGAGACGFYLATASELRDVDTSWGRLRRTSDTHGWEWKRVLLEARVCVYALRSTDGAIAALFGVQGKALELGPVATTRLDYFQVSPLHRGTGVARLAFAAFARMAIVHGRSQLVLGALPAPKVVRFYGDLGGMPHEPAEWNAGKGLVKFLFDSATLRSLAEYADAVQEENHP